MLGPLLAAGASLIGNIMGQQNQQAINTQNYWAQLQQNVSNFNQANMLQDKQIRHVEDINRQNLAAQEMANFRNIDLARENRDLAILQADKYALMAQQDKAHDRALQQDFAQMGIQWRAQDALKAGIHPIFALGGGGAAYSPSAISLSAPQFSAPQVQASQAQAASLGSAPMGVAPRAVAGNSFSNMGQDISRAILAAANESTRSNAFEGAYQDLTLKNLGLRNDLLASQIARNSQAGGVQKSVTQSDWPGAIEIKETPQTPVIHRGNVGNMPKGNMDAQSGADVFGEGPGEYTVGLMNAYDWFNFNPGTAYKYFQWVNSNMISKQMRQEYFDTINVPKYQQQGPAYMRQNWKGHY